MSSSFLPAILNLSLMVTNARWDVQLPLKEVITPTQFANIDVVISKLSLGKLESELLAERDSQDLRFR